MAEDSRYLPPPAEPWSALARDEPSEGVRAVDALARTLARERLAEEIRQYVTGRISGRAFLIAGHRGAGKTTAVLTALQQVYNDCSSPTTLDSELTRYRPLLVRLHAPSLWLEPPVRADAEKKPSDADDQDEPQDDRTLRFLQEMAAGILPALLDELQRRLRALQCDEEMVAHVSDELSRGMPIGEQRELARRMGWLATGLLPNDGRSSFDQLVTINAASEAYLIVTGKLQLSSEASQSLAQALERKLSQELQGSGLIRPLAVAGAALSATVGLQASQPLAALAAALALLVSGFAYSSSATSKLARGAAYSRSFSQDNTHRALFRRVPLLVEQLRQAGFPVIFLVDEFDKLDHGHELLDWLMKSVKSYVTERSFICFVVERSYYQRVLQAQHPGRRPASPAPGPTPPWPPWPPAPPKEPPKRYGPSHTFFSRLAYVAIFPSEFHEFLRRRLGGDGPTEEIQLLRASARHFVLHSSHLHAYDTEQVLGRLRASGDLARAEAGAAPPLKWHVHAWLQICLEWVVSEPKFFELCAEDPYFMQVGYDVLYGVTSNWQMQERVDEAEPGLGLPKEVLDALEPRAHKLLEEARKELIESLRDSSRLMREVIAKASPERIERFLLDGVADPQRTRAREVSSKLRSGQPLEWQPWTIKYQLIRDLGRRLPGAGLLDSEGQWTYDEHGLAIERKDDAEALSHEYQRIRAAHVGRIDGLIFTELFELALAPLSFSSFEQALSAYQTDPTDTTRATVLPILQRLPRLEEFRSFWHTAYTALGGVASDRKVKLLRYAIEGLDEQRLQSAKAVGEFLRQYLPNASRTTDSVWLDSVLERILASLESRAPQPAIVKDARALDVVAAEYGWFPPGLREAFESDLELSATASGAWFRARSWTIVTASRLASFEPSSLPDHERCLAAIAAVRLNQPTLAKNLIGLLLPTPTSAPLARALAWLQQVLSAAPPQGRLRVFLLNPGPILSRWKPVTDIPVAAVSIDDEQASASSAASEAPGPASVEEEGSTDSVDLVFFEDLRLRELLATSGSTGPSRLDAWTIFVKAAPDGQTPGFDEQDRVLQISNAQDLADAIALTLRSKGR